MAKSSLFRGVTLFRPTGKWRAQISALGRTVSLGDHDTEEEAARAFDRAAINKGGRTAKTNFPTAEYEAEVNELTGLSQEELVAMLRSRARKNGSQASTYRGVSLLKQTGRWQAQISLGGKQVHLGYFLSEQLAAKAYDRAAINNGISTGQTPPTNFEEVSYSGELEVLNAMDQDAFVTALADEEQHQGLVDMLGQGFTLQGARAVFGPSFMQPSSKASASQAGASTTHRKTQALQQSASGPPSASTSKVSTRKRKLADAASEAAAAVATSSTAAEASAAQQASSAALHSNHIVRSSDPAEASYTVTQPISTDQNASNQGSHTKRRSSRRNSGNSTIAQPAVAAAVAAASAGEQQHSTDKAPQVSSKPFHAQVAKPYDTNRAAEVTRASAGRSSFRESARKEAVRLQTQSEVRCVQAGREQAVAPPAAAGSPRWTRAGSVGRADVKESSGKPCGSQEKANDAEQGGAGEPAGSERDRRVMARRQQAAKPKSSKSSRGTAASSAATSSGHLQLQQLPQASAQAMGGMPSNDAMPAGNIQHIPVSPAIEVEEGAGCSNPPAADGDSPGVGNRADATSSQQTAAADGHTMQHQEELSANDSPVAKSQDLIAREALGAALHSTAAAAGNTRRAREAAALAASDGPPMGTPRTAGKPSTPTAAGQLNTTLDGGQSHGSPPATRESVRATESAAGMAHTAPDIAAKEPVPAQETSANPAPPQQKGTLGNPLPSSSSAAASGAVPNSLCPSPPSPATSKHPAAADAAISAAQAGDAVALTSADSAKATAALDETITALAQHAQHGGSGIATPVEDAGSNAAVAAKGSQVMSQRPAENKVAAAAVAEAAVSAAVEPITLWCQAAAVQGSFTPGVQSDFLSTPPASPSAGPPSITPLTAQAAGTAATAEHPSLHALQHAGTGQALFRPLAVDSSSCPVMCASAATALRGALTPTTASAAMPQGEQARPLLSDMGSTAGVVSPRARASDLKLNLHAQQSGSRSEAISTGGGPAPSRSAAASTAIAAAARANAAAANAIAESGALANSSIPGASEQSPSQRAGEAFGGAVRTFTVPANTPLAPGAFGPVATAAAASEATSHGHAGASASGPLLAGVISAGRPGLLAAGQAGGMPASQAPSMPMSQQQHLDGTAFMTAMQQSLPTSTQDAFSGTAVSATQTAAGLLNRSHPAQQAPAPGQSPQPFPNPNFCLPPGPASYKGLADPSIRGTSLAGPLVNPSFLSSSSALDPGPSGNPAALGPHSSALGLSSVLPNPVITEPAGSHTAPGNPVSPSYNPQGLSAAALESGNQAISPAVTKGSWSQGKTPMQGLPTPVQGYLPAGAQATPATARPQPALQLPPPTSLAPQLPGVQSRGMTNAHAIVPGVPPTPAGRSPNTAWQVGLAAGLAATANLRPPNPALGHQAATTAAAARAAAAFQASRALSMAKSHSQQSPLLQQGSVGPGVSGPAATAHGPRLAGPSTKPSFEPTPQAAATAASTRSLTTSGHAIADGNRQADSPATAAAGAATTMGGGMTLSPTATAASTAAAPSSGSYPIASHQAFARQALPPAAATAGAHHAPARPMMPPSAYSAEAQALYRARALQQQPYVAQSRPYLAQTPQTGAPHHPSYVSLSQPPYNVQTHTPYIAPSQVPYVAPSQTMYKPAAQAPYGAMYPTATPAQARYATANQRYAAAAPQPRPPLQPQLNVEHFNFAKLAPQPKNSIDIISEDAVLPTFPLKKKKLKKRKLAGFEVFAADVAKHKGMALESRSNPLQRRFSRDSPTGRPPKDFRPRAPAAAQQAQQRPAKASSVTSLPVKPKGKATKGQKGKQAAATKGTKGKKGSKAADDDTPRKKSNRTNWSVCGVGRRRRVEQASSGRQYADAARLHQEAVGTSGLEQLLGVLEEEFSDFEQAQPSDSDDGQVSATAQGGPSRASTSGRGRGCGSGRRSKAPKPVQKASGAGRGRGKGKGTTESAAGRVVKVRKRAASSSPDRGPVRSNRRKIQPPSRD